MKQRLQGGFGEPREQPDVAFRPNKAVSVEDVLHGRVPPEVQADLDRVIAEAASVTKKRSR